METTSLETGVELWLAFNAGVVLLILLDLGVFQRRREVMPLREALAWSAFWVALALAFNLVVYAWRGPQVASEFLLGYLMEKSLSVDNLFVFVMIFSYFAVHPAYHRRVLSLGILGALVLRGVFIGTGSVLLDRFHWMTYVFGAFLVYTGYKMLAHDDAEHCPQDNPVVRLFRRFVNTTDDYHGDRFLVREHGRWVATPLLIVLLVVESSDVMFAVDSIPAVFAVTRDPFIVYTSNVCAILGLRALYFLLAGMATQVRFLKAGIAVVLVFVGVKMGLQPFYKIPSEVSLLVVAATLGAATAASWLFPTVGGAASEADEV